ncbi:JAB domain-containing protein [Baileyella intestinalis]|nr:JAB domain-containing protein [Baileyella intestinalis]
MPKKSENEIKVVNVRLVKEPSLYSTKEVTSPEAVMEVVAGELKNYDREVFAVLNLKTNGKPINLHICSVGTLDAAMINPREAFKAIILSNAAAFICIHNHPSGNCEPSQADIAVTERLVKCGELMGIKMLDHIIIAGETGEQTSFLREGLLDGMRSRDDYTSEWER